MIWLCRIGAVAYVQERMAFQPLTPFFHMLDVRPGDTGHLERVARAVEALSIGVDHLYAAYDCSPLEQRDSVFPYSLADERCSSWLVQS